MHVGNHHQAALLQSITTHWTVFVRVLPVPRESGWSRKALLMHDAIGLAKVLTARQRILKPDRLPWQLDRIRVDASSCCTFLILETPGNAF